MTRSDIQAVLDRVRTWPEERQVDAAQMILALERSGTDIYRLDVEERADIDAALIEDARGDMASDEDVHAVFQRLAHKHEG